MKSTFHAALVALVMFIPGLARAQQGPDMNKVARIALIAGWRLENGHIMGALRVTLAPGWKTYWRASGGSGIPPQFAWNGSRNLKNVAFHWPRPELIKVQGVTVIGYKNELVLPIEFTPKVNGQKIEARAHLEIGICSDICVPVARDLALTLDTAARTPNFLIQLALADQPLSGAKAGLGATSCHLEKIKDGYRVTGRFSLPAEGNAPEMVVFESPQEDIWIAPATTHREGGTLISSADMVSLSGQPFPPPSLRRMRITLIGKARAVELPGCGPAS